MIPSVYRCYDAEGTLLYIGMSGDVTRRMIAHRCHTPWGRSVARIDVTIHASREEALRVEAEDIRRLAPHWNGLTVQDQRPRKKPQPVVLAATDFGRALEHVDSGLTIAAWAERFGVSRPYFYSLLDGSRNPSIAVARRIADGTGGAVPVWFWPNHAAVVDEVSA